MKAKFSITDLEKSVKDIRNTADKDEKSRLYQQYLSALRKLAYRNNAEAQYCLAVHYEDYGTMGDPNPYYNVSKKLYWYIKAANNNHASACNNLADIYERGDGCKKDIRKALELYKRAAELGDWCGKKNYPHLKKQLKKVGLLDWAIGGVAPPQFDELLKQLYNKVARVCDPCQRSKVKKNN